MTNPVSCYDRIICCCLCRALKICKRNPEPVIEVAQIRINNTSLENQPTHHRERTWKLSNGKMTYEFSHAVTREGISDER